jgi:hypothetical protein
MQNQTLSIALSQDSLGLAVFKEQQLEYLEAYSLRAMPKAAEASAGYVLRCIATFLPTTAVLHDAPNTSSEIREAITEALKASGRPVYEISAQEILASFGDPPLESKEELRYMMRVLFPQIPSSQLVLSSLDAVASGLHFQTKRLLAAN